MLSHVEEGQPRGRAGQLWGSELSSVWFPEILGSGQLLTMAVATQADAEEVPHPLLKIREHE